VASLRPLLLFFWTGLAGAAPFVAPSPTGHVTDSANVLSPAEERRLGDAMDAIFNKKGIELAVLTVADLAGLAIEEYGVKVFEAWRLGKRGEDRGVLLLVAPRERAVRIEVGYGLEGDLTDAHSGRIIRTVMVPEFKEGRYGAGTVAGVEALIEHLDDVDFAGTSAGKGSAVDSGGIEGVADLVFDLLVSAIAVLLVLGIVGLLFILMAGGRMMALVAGVADLALLAGLGNAMLGGNVGWLSLLLVVLLVIALVVAVAVRLGGRRGQGLLGRIRSACVEIVAAKSSGGARSSRGSRSTEGGTNRTSTPSSSRSSSDARPSRPVGGGGRSGGGGASGHW
jgi:uncharacterized protein